MIMLGTTVELSPPIFLSPKCFFFDQCQEISAESQNTKNKSKIKNETKLFFHFTLGKKKTFQHRHFEEKVLDKVDTV